MKKMIMVFVALFVVSVVPLSVCAQTAVDAKQSVMIIAHQGFQDDEFAVPKQILEENGIAVIVASTALTAATGMNGMQTKPDILVEDINVDDFDLVVFVGGAGAFEHLDDPLLHQIANQAHSSGKLVGAICIAPAILAKAGILEGRDATVYEAGIEHLKANNAVYTGDAVSQDGNIITASGPQAAEEFGKALVKELQAQ